MKKNSIVIYKNFCALTGDEDGEKFIVEWCVSPKTSTGKKAVFATQKVRNRDVIFLAEGNSFSLEEILDFEKEALQKESSVQTSIKELWELLNEDEDFKNKEIPFLEIVELAFDQVDSKKVWGIYKALKSTFFFKEVIDNSSAVPAVHFLVQTKEQITEAENKAFEKENAQKFRDEFINRLKILKLSLPEDSKYMVEVEAFALGKTDKCKILHDAHIKETVEKAHEILLKTGIWNITRNPYPTRWGLSTKSAGEELSSPPDEERFEVNHTAFAIDSPWSDDPDDAVFFDGEYLWVHIADPASTVKPDSTIDKSARNRGATLYLPEGAARMLNEGCLEDYALGLKEKSRALSFKIKLDENCEIIDTEVIPTFVNVKRLTYEMADTLYDSAELNPLFKIAEKNEQRRKKNGAISITMPEIHVVIDKETKKVSMQETVRYKSGELVREAMILAGEGAAKFAFKNNIPFPFISQDAPDIPKELPEGLAGQYRLRRCMRKRNVSVTPSRHAAMGLSFYSQVTSPLRRYGDLIAHEQLRAFLKNEPLIDKDEMLVRISAGDEAARSAKQAERNSTLHWTLVYLLQNPSWSGKAVCLSNEAKQDIFFVSELGLEVPISGTGSTLNQEITVKPQKIDLPNLLVTFVQVSEN